MSRGSARRLGAAARLRWSATSCHRRGRDGVDRPQREIPQRLSVEQLAGARPDATGLEVTGDRPQAVTVAQPRAQLGDHRGLGGLGLCATRRRVTES